MAAPAPGPSLFGALADPHRWQLLAALARSDHRVAELTELTATPQNLVSYHLGELRRAGLVASRRSSADGREVYYRADLGRYRELLAGAAGALHPGLRLAADPAPQPAPPRSRRPRVLFLCTGNSSRSQMAEALLVHRSAGTVDARSAGSHPKPVHPDAIRVMAARGVDISTHEPKHLRRFLRTRFDRVVTLCDKVREVCPEFPGGPDTAHWSIADPAVAVGRDKDTYPAFVRVAEELDSRIQLLVADLRAQPSERLTHAR